jgi:HD-GYP domain-containing protein (c-di-GMP phosphodiesterase class II)
MEDRVRLADLLAGLSLVSDLGLGLQPDDAVRACLIAVGLAEHLDLDRAEIATIFYTSLLQHIGCTGYAHESYLVWGDDLAANRAAQRTNFAEPADLFRTYLPTLTKGQSLQFRARIATNFVTRGPGFLDRFTTATCEAAALTARRLGLPRSVQRGLHEVFEWWNGKGAPRGLAGDDIALAGRISYVAGVAAKFSDLGGASLARDAVGRRAGTILDPDIAAAFHTHAAQLLADASSGDPRRRFLEIEPDPVRIVSPGQLASVAAAFGDVADLKTPFTHGHSAGVAQLARSAGQKLGLGADTLRDLHLAGLLHDVGRVAISNAVWEKTGPLTRADWEQVRLHAYQSERILSCSPTLGPVAAIAGMHHERSDGSGYHRECTSAQLSVPARVLAVADSVQAMTQPRPHRTARSVAEAAEQIEHEVRAGRLDPEAATAVLDVIGAVLAPGSSPRPATLTEREIEVLRLLARGLSNRAIAGRLHISPRTAEVHVQHIYAKVGMTSRAAVALFAMEHGLVTPNT